MKYLALIAACLITGCTVTVKPDEATLLELKKHEAVLNLITNYIADCQAKGICPKPEVKEKKK